MYDKELVYDSSLILLGCVLFVCVMATLKWDFKKLSTAKFETNTHEVDEAFGDISISTDTAAVVFALSDDGKCRVECYEEEKARHSVTVEKDVLTIRVNDRQSWSDHIGFRVDSPKITVYLPKAEYTMLSICESTGSIHIPKDFSFTNVDISSTTGDVAFHASASKSIKIKSSTGNIRVEDATADSLDLSVTTGTVNVSGVTCESDVTVDVSTGKAYLTDIACENIVSSGSTGNITLNHVIAKSKLSIERSTGDVKFSKCDAGEMFIITNTGDVTGSLLSAKVFITHTDTGNVNVPETITGGRCEIHTDTGNIEIKIN